MKTNALKGAVAKAAIIALALSAGSCATSQEKKETASAGPVVEAPKTDIHTAAVTGDVAAIRQHIQAGTDLNERDPFGGSSPLISASLFGKPEVVKVLIDAGANLDFQNNDGSTPLHVAAFFGHPEIVKMLLDKGADRSKRNKFGATPYESVAGPFSDVESTYDMMGKMLGPIGLKLDYAHLKEVRPVIAGMLK